MQNKPLSNLGVIWGTFIVNVPTNVPEYNTFVAVSLAPILIVLFKIVL
jgi:hypothetical protein